MIELGYPARLLIIVFIKLIDYPSNTGANKPTNTKDTYKLSGKLTTKKAAASGNKCNNIIQVDPRTY